MNRVYRTVFNRHLGRWQVAPETARSRGKAGLSAVRDHIPIGARTGLSVAVLMLALGAGPALAGGSGGNGGANDSAGLGGAGSDGTATNAGGAAGGDVNGDGTGIGGGAPGANGGDGSAGGGGGGGNAVSAPYERGMGGAGGGGNGGASGVTVDGAGAAAPPDGLIAGQSGEDGFDHGGGGGGDGIVFVDAGNRLVQADVEGGNGGKGDDNELDASAASGDGGGGGGGGAGLVFIGAGSMEIGGGVSMTGGNGGSGGTGTLDGGGGGGGGAGIGFASTGSLDIGSEASVAGGSGGAGGHASYGGNGGGGGAGVVFAGATELTIGRGASVTGGSGGQGAEGYDGGGRGGAGGAGGAGLLGNSAEIVNSGTIKGGAGGNAGDAGTGGTGGVGGTGISGSSLAIANSGIIEGGNGGAGGVGWRLSDGSDGIGGAGIAGSDLTVINSGVIRGGISGDVGGDGATRANAVTFTGGINRLELHAGAVIEGNVVADGVADTLVLGGADDGSFDVGAIGAAAQYRGFESFLVAGDGTWSLTGDGTGFSGTTTVSGGALMVESAFGGSVDVLSGATLGGSGTVGAGSGTTVTIASGGILAPGSSIGTLTVGGDLVLATGSILDFEIGGPGTPDDPASGTSDRIAVGGDLTLNGTLNLTQSSDPADGAVGLGYYRLATYGGDLHGDGLTLGDTPSVDGAGGFELLTGGGRVDLFVAALGDDVLQHWQGGDGVWNAAASQWLNKAGETAVAWAGNHAVFRDAGAFTGGRIAVEGVQGFAGLQFVDGGYRLEGGGMLETRAGGSEIRVLADEAEIGTAIGGTGGIVKTAAGTLLLSGTNSYTGGTVVQAGTLRAGSADAFVADTEYVVNGGTLDLNGYALSMSSLSGSGGEVALNGAALTVDQGGDTTFAGAISGNGSLTLAGAGMLTLTGDSTHAGGTRIRSGTLILDGATLSHDAGDMHIGTDAGGAAGSLVIENGGRAKIGVGLLASETGSSGALSVVGNGSTLEAVTGLTVGDKGEGILTIADGATVSAPEILLTSEATATGTLNIGAAADQAARAAGRLDATRLNFGTGQGTLVFNHTESDYVLAADISGTGSIRQDAGTTTYAGDGSGFSGTVSLNGGMFNVNGSLGGLVNVRDDTKIGGSGTLGSVALAAGATMAPGNSIGVLTLTGDVHFAAGSTYEVEIGGGGAAPGVHNDFLQVSGTARLEGGTVLVNALDPKTSYVNGQTYTIMTAGKGVQGAFGSAASESIFLAPTLAYDEDNVYLTIALPSAPDIFTGVARSGNQLQAAMALDDLEQTGDALSAYNAIVGAAASPDVARRIFDLSSGEIHASGRHVIDRSAALFTRTLRRQGAAGLGSPTGFGAPATSLAYGLAGAAAVGQPEAGAGRRVRQAWLAPLAARGSIDGDGNAAGLDWRTAGIAGGVENVLDVASGEAFGGIGLGYRKGRGTADARLSTLNAEDFQVGVYGGWTDGTWTLSGALSYGASRIDTDRRIVIGGIERTADADYWAHSIGISGAAAYGIDVGGGTTVSPLFTLDAGWSGHNGFAESGAGALSLSGASERWSRFDTGLGVALEHVVAARNGKMAFEGRAVWEHAFADPVPNQSLSFAGSPTGFDVRGAEGSRDRLRIGAGVAWEVTGRVTLRASYDAVLADDQVDHAAGIGFHMRF